MPEIIADTSALIAFFVRSEVRHRDARLYFDEHIRQMSGLGIISVPTEL